MTHLLHPATPAPAPPLPTLSVSDNGRAYLHLTLSAHLGLFAGQRINLVPPPKGSPYWHLDLRPEATNVVHVQHGKRLRIQDLRLPFGLLDPDAPLTLYLLPGEPARPGYYPLLPATEFDQAYIAFLTQAAQDARQAAA